MPNTARFFREVMMLRLLEVSRAKCSAWSKQRALMRRVPMKKPSERNIAMGLGFLIAHDTRR